MHVSSAASSLPVSRPAASSSLSAPVGADGHQPARLRVDAFEGRTVSEADQNRKVVDDFYSAFERKDGAAMTAAYAPGARFSDKVFPDLRGNEPGAMWRMLCKSKDLRIRHEIVKAEGDTVVAKWVANYKFNGRDIENHVTATIKLKDGKIVEHKDDFDMPKWLGQAYGMAAKLPFAEHVLGGLTRHVAGNRLQDFIARGG